MKPTLWLLGASAAWLVSCKISSDGGSAIRPYFGYQIVDTNNDGVDDLVGAGVNGMAVVDGKTHKARALGIKEPGAWQFAAGKIVTASRETPRVLHVIDFATGKELKSFALSDNIASMLPRDDKSPNLLVVTLIDQHTHLLDLAALTMVEHPAAAATAQATPTSYRPIFCAGMRAECSWDDKTSSDPHVATLVQGINRVSIRIKKPGTRELSAVCFDASSRETAPTMIDPKGYGIKGIELADGRLYVSYLGAVHAFDALTCAPLWQLGLDANYGAPEALQAVHGRVYVTTAGKRNYGKNLVVLDGSSGALLFAP